jgi:YD repeat-containing protein
VADAFIFWQGIPADLDQEASVTFDRIGKEAGRPQSNGIWGEGVIEVLYDAPGGTIQVWGYDLEAGWVQMGKDLPVEFADGDQFSVRFGKDGAIEIYRNGKLLARRALGALPPQAEVSGSTPEPVAYNAPMPAQVDLNSLRSASVSTGSTHRFQNISYHPLKVSAALLPYQPLPNHPLQGPTSLTIDYTYDALRRLTSATYSDGRIFSYTYDPAGNVLELQKNLGPGTVVTTYTYDTANQLMTAAENGVTWQYHYDANGSLIETLPDGNATTGAKRYTYNAAGYLTQAEAHNGADWTTQSEMDYNGLGQRLSLDAAGVIAQYVLDGNQPLTSESGDNTTFYLYGMGAIGEKTTDWAYSLPDGTYTPRQLADASGEILLSTRYDPWGGVLEIGGNGAFTFGYLGGILDTTTGLLYIGNGQYYDPATGRFLTRGFDPESPNPYIPWNPLGAIIGPMGLLALVFQHKRGKRSKITPFLFILVMLVVLPITVGMACDGDDTPPAPTPADQPPGAETPGGPENDPGSTPSPSGTPTPILEIPECPTAPTPIPIPTATKTIFFGGSDGVNLANPGPDPKLQTPVWVQNATQVVPYPGGSKADQANQVDINTYKDVNLIVIGYSAGGDAALMFADKYRIHQFQNSGTGKITDIAVLGGTMSGTMTDGRNLAQEWPNVLGGLLVWGTDVYILDDKAAGGGEANGYQPPANATGTFHFVQRNDEQYGQEHWDGGLGGQLGIGTNNSESFKNEVYSWFNSY